VSGHLWVMGFPLFFMMLRVHGDGELPVGFTELMDHILYCTKRRGSGYLMFMRAGNGYIRDWILGLLN
jgi:hypothetical protein